MAYADVYANKASDIPSTKHWVILEFGSIHIEGDARSKSAPGHGYPERDEPTIQYLVYRDEEKFKEELKSRWLQRLSGYITPFVGIEVNGQYEHDIAITLRKT